MQISVIIPIYNAAKYVRQAVESALCQPEVEEVILVEDGSQDNSLEICQKISVSESKVHLFRHANGGNHGAGASRNLAIQMSHCDFIAFLDADDYYLPSRFSVTKHLFEENSELEGVYEAIGLDFSDEAGALRWQTSGLPKNRLQTLTKIIPPEELFSALVEGGFGHFHLDGLVIKKEIIQKTGYLDEELPLHQDSAFMVKVAALSTLLPGMLEEPVAIWRVHPHNRFSAPRSNKDVYLMKVKYWYSLWNWSKNNLDCDHQFQLFFALLREAQYRSRFKNPFPRWLLGMQKRVQLALLPFLYPAVLEQITYWKAYLPHPTLWYSPKQKN